MPEDGGTVKREMDMLAVLKALGDETRFSMYRELASSTQPADARTSSPTGSASTPTPFGCTSSGCREAGLVDVEAVHRGTVGRPQHVYSLASGRARARVRPAQLHAARRLARRAGRAHRRRRRGSGRDRPPLGRRGRSPHPLALVREGARRRARTARVRPRSPMRTTATSRSPSCTARSGSSPRPIPSWCATCTAGSAKVSSMSVGGGSVDDFATLYDHDPCRVTVAVGYPEDA